MFGLFGKKEVYYGERDGNPYEYTGDVLNGKPHGNGKMTFKGGDMHGVSITGSFSNGILLDGTVRNPSGTVIARGIKDVR